MVYVSLILLSSMWRHIELMYLKVRQVKWGRVFGVAGLLALYQGTQRMMIQFSYPCLTSQGRLDC